jgi:hypothetical protein
VKDPKDRATAGQMLEHPFLHVRQIFYIAFFERKKNDYTLFASRHISKGGGKASSWTLLLGLYLILNIEI